MAKAKILYVEDSETQANTIKDFLERNEYDVILVDNGKSAINAAKSQPPDIVLLDVILPDITGYEVCRWLKLNSDTREIPIIMLTVKGSVSDKVTGLEAGADDYLPKPFDEIELNARIYACLRTKALQDELKQKNRQLEELLEKVKILASTDPLTKLSNRRHFEVVLENEFKRAARYNSPLACLMIDIDYFKKINDGYGHHTGDLVLHEIAHIIENAIREIDVTARWGGEEFVVLLPQTGKEGALQSASRILKAIVTHKFTCLPDKKITASIGIASLPDPSINTGEKLIDASDIAMYEAKRKGRNRTEIT